MTVRLARERDLLVRPFVHDTVAVNEGRIPEPIHEAKVAGPTIKGPQHLERAQHHLRRYITHGIDDAVDIEIPGIGPLAEEAHPFHIDRGSGADQVFDGRLRVGARVHQGELPAHTVAEDAVVFLAGRSLHFFEARRHEVLNVVLEAETLIFRTRNSPIDHEDVESLLHHVLNKALPQRQIQDKGLAHEGHHEDDGNPIDLAQRAVMVEAKGAA